MCHNGEIRNVGMYEYMTLMLMLGIHTALYKFIFCQYNTTTSVLLTFMYFFGHTHLKSYSDLICNKVGWLVGKKKKDKLTIN